MSEPPIRFAIVGCAADDPSWQDDYPWQDIAMRLRGGDLCVVVDPNRDRAQAAADSVGASIVEDSLEAALASHAQEFDAIVMRPNSANRSAFNLSAVQMAAQSGKHVFFESPIAESLTEARGMVDSCAAAGVCFGGGRMLRFAPSNQTIMDRLSRGKLGEPGLLRVHRWRTEPRQSSVERLYGDIDLSIWFYGTRPSEVYAVGKRTDDVDAWGYIQVHFGFPGGGMAIMDFASMLPDGETYDSLSLISSQGAAYSDDHRNTHLRFGGGPAAALISRQGSGHVVRAYQSFVDSIRDAASPSRDGDDCLTVHLVADTILQSLETGNVYRKQGDTYGPS